MPSRFWSFSSPSSYLAAGECPALAGQREKSWANVSQLPSHQLKRYSPHTRFISSEPLLKRQKKCSFLKPCQERKARSHMFVTHDFTDTSFPFHSVQTQHGTRRLRWAEAHNEITAKFMSRFFAFCDDQRDCGQNVEVLRRVKSKPNNE